MQSENSKIDNTVSNLGEIESKTERKIDPKFERLREFVLNSRNLSQLGSILLSVSRKNRRGTTEAVKTFNMNSK